MDDISGVHIRLARSCHALGVPDWIKDISGACVGEHQRGKDKNETPHFHCWLPNKYYKYDISGGIQAEARNWYNDRIPDLSGAWKGKGNGLWMWKLHDSFEKWVAYVFYNDAECKDPKVCLWNRPDPPPTPRLIKNLIIPALDVEGGRAHDGVPVPVCVVAPSAPQKNKSKREPAHIRFHAYCSDIWDGPNDTPELDEIMDAWIDWTQGAYELRNVSAPIRYTWYMLNKKDPKMKRTMKEEMRRKLFSEY